jgi:hypothetical protein
MKSLGPPKVPIGFAIFIRSKAEIVMAEFFGRLVPGFWSLCNAFMMLILSYKLDRIESQNIH